MALDPINSAIFNIADMIGLNSKSAKPAEVGFNLNEFKANITKFNGIAKTSYFLVNIYNQYGYAIDGEKKFTFERAFGNDKLKTESMKIMSFFCEATNLPGLRFEVGSTRRYGIGPNIKTPISVEYPDLSLSFLGDNQGNINGFFRHWMNTVMLNNFEGPVNADSTDQEMNVGTGGTFAFRKQQEIFRKAPYQFEYKNLYQMIIEVSLFDPDSRRFETRTFLECYPLAVGDISLAWINQDSFMRIPVTIGYSRYYTSSENYPAPRASQAGNLTLLQKLIKVGTVAQTLSTLKKPRGVADVINLTNNASIAGGGLRGLF